MGASLGAAITGLTTRMQRPSTPSLPLFLHTIQVLILSSVSCTAIDVVRHVCRLHHHQIFILLARHLFILLARHLSVLLARHLSVLLARHLSVSLVRHMLFILLARHLSVLLARHLCWCVSFIRCSMHQHYSIFFSSNTETLFICSQYIYYFSSTC